MISGIYLFLCANFFATIVAYYKKCYDSHSLCLITNTDEGINFTLSQISASRWCKDHSSSLVIVTNATVQSTIARFINDSNAKLLAANVIADGYRLDLRGWKWTNGEHHQSSSYSYSLACLLVSTYSQIVYYGDASDKRKFICSYNLSHTSESSCSNGYRLMGMICYKIRNETVTWFEARYLCLQEVGNDLALFDNGIPSLTSETRETYWIGLRRERWAWWNDQGYYEDVKYFNWDDLNPRPKEGDCLCLRARTGKWINCDCIEKYRYICIQEMTTDLTAKVTSSSAPTTTQSSPSTFQSHSTSTQILEDNFSSDSSGDSLHIQESDNLGILLGLGVGSACLLILIIVIVVIVCIKNRQSHSDDHEPMHGNSPPPMTYKDDAPNTVYALVVPNDDEPVRSPTEKTFNQTVYAELDLEPKGKITRRASQPYPSERTPDQSVYAEVDLLPKRKTLGRTVGEQESEVYANSLQVDCVYANNAQTKV